MFAWAETLTGSMTFCQILEGTFSKYASVDSLGHNHFFRVCVCVCVCVCVFVCAGAFSNSFCLSGQVRSRSEDFSSSRFT